jgi:hypothetical protein
MTIGRGNRSTRRKPAPAPLCPPQNPHDQTRARTRAAAVGSRGLTAWAMARPTHKHDFHWAGEIKSFRGRKCFVQTMLVTGHRQQNRLGKIPKSWLTIKLTPWRPFTPKRTLTLIGLRGFVSQKTELFTAAVVRMSNPAAEIRFHCPAKLSRYPAVLKMHTQ